MPPEDGEDTMKHGCSEAQRELQMAWSDGQLAETLRDPEETTVTTRDLARHLEECLSCQKEAESLETLDRFLHEGFRDLEHSTRLPSEDQIASMLRRVHTAPDAQVLRRVRRSVGATLWMVFFLLCLLACCTLGFLAYRAYRVLIEQ